jgi:hypothetical protein
MSNSSCEKTINKWYTNTYTHTHTFRALTYMANICPYMMHIIGNFWIIRILTVHERKRNTPQKMRLKHQFQNCALRCPWAPRDIHICKGNTKLQIAEGGNNVSDEREVIAIKLFVSNYLINRSVRYFFWHRGAVKKLLTLRVSWTEKAGELLA